MMRICSQICPLVMSLKPLAILKAKGRGWGSILGNESWPQGISDGWGMNGTLVHFLVKVALCPNKWGEAFPDQNSPIQRVFTKGKSLVGLLGEEKTHLSGGSGSSTGSKTQCSVLFILSSQDAALPLKRRPSHALWPRLVPLKGQGRRTASPEAIKRVRPGWVGDGRQ